MKKYNIKIIVEGNEEKAFFEIVETVGKDDIFFLDIENAKGSGGIPDAFLIALRENELYDCIVCVYDVDNRINDIHSPYNLIRTRLNSLFGDDKITDYVSFCTNPNILQLFLLAADSLKNVSLTSTSKSENTSLVHKYWPKIASGKKDNLGRNIKPDYDGRLWQLDIMKYSIINGDYNYKNLLNNLEELPIDYKNNIPASNIFPLLKALKNGDSYYFLKIKKEIEKTVS